VEHDETAILMGYNNEDLWNMMKELLMKYNEEDVRNMMNELY